MPPDRRPPSSSTLLSGGEEARFAADRRYSTAELAELAAERRLSARKASNESFKAEWHRKVEELKLSGREEHHEKGGPRLSPVAEGGGNALFVFLRECLMVRSSVSLLRLIGPRLSPVAEGGGKHVQQGSWHPESRAMRHRRNVVHATWCVTDAM